MHQTKLYRVLMIGTAIAWWLLFLLDMVAHHYFLYWKISWFDILMHGLGGLAIGLLSASFLVRFKALLSHKILLACMVVAGAVFFGFVWESLEFVVDFFLGLPLHQPSVADTLGDLVMDYLGGCLAGLIALFIIHYTYES